MTKTTDFAATEVLVKADKWLDRRQAVSCAPPHQVAREAGRYEKSGEELARAVLKYRKAEGKK
jgi:hypothetical protein